MLDWSTIIAQLGAHAEAHDLTARAEQGCAACFENEGGSIDGWTVADFRTEFHSHKLACGHPSHNPHFETILNLHDLNGEEFGYYRLITDLDGQVRDDYLVFHFAKNERSKAIIH